jgi:hypothetical protein
MRSVLTYMQERFPLPLVTLMALSFAAASLGLFSAAPLVGADWWWSLILLTVAYLAVLLRYRVTDEWKDFAHDSSVYPDRPVQRGAISPRALVSLGVVALVVELASVAVLGGAPGLAVYLAVLVLSALTAVEFFARDVLERHFTLSLVLHQAVYLPLFGWAAFVLGAPFDASTLAGVASATALFVVAEIVRKFEPRHAPNGDVVRDTYPAVWGRGAAIVVIVLSLLAAAALAVAAGVGVAVLVIAVVFAIALAVARRSDRAVMAVGGLAVPVLAMAMLS